MNRPFIIRPFAELDLAEAWEFYRAQRPGLEEEFIAHVHAAIKKIAEAPFLYPKIHKQCRTARVEAFPFNVVYTVQADVIFVVAVYHASRKPSAWRKRLG